MTLDTQVDFGSAVATLKTDIRRMVQAAFDGFEARTGLTPRGIDIRVIEKTAHGDKIRRFCVGDVRVSLGEF